MVRLRFTCFHLTWFSQRKRVKEVLLSLRVYSSPTLDPTTSPTNSFHSTTYKKAKMLRVLLVCWFVGWLEQLKALIRNLCVTHWTKLNAKWNYELFIISHGFLWFSSKPISGIWQCPQVHRKSWSKPKFTINICTKF